jgi:hypothetical protein
MLGKFEELKARTPGDLVKAIDRAVRLYCAPLPSVNAITIPLDATQVEQILGRSGEPATTIVAINVEPGLNTPYGCRSCSDECKACKDQGAECSCKGKEIGELAKMMNVSERQA